MMKDVQNTPDTRNVDIQRVGTKDIELPLTVQRKNNTDQVVLGTAKVAVSLPRNFKGTHMSRFVEVLREWETKQLLGVDVKGCLEKVIKKLHAQSGIIEFKFKYFISKKSPVTKLAAPMCYECLFKGKIEDGKYKFILGVKVPVTTLCPCSKEISKYGAHNQRAVINVKISYPESEHVWIEDLVEMIENCASCPLYPLLKRQDEKYVTEKAWENPRFVEDVLREVVIKLRGNPVITEFEVDCEAFESIHNHSAWAYQKEIKQ